MKNKNIIFIIIGVLILGSAVWLGVYLGGDSSNTQTSNGVSPEVSITNDKQVIDITAKGGYTPNKINAKAGLATVLRITTSGTFDCSSSVVIPKLNYRKSLQPTGVEEINISAANAQGTLQGLCSMGMYGFKINFN